MLCVENSVEYFVLMRAHPGHQKTKHAATSIWYLLMAVRGVSSLDYFVVEALIRKQNGRTLEICNVCLSWGDCVL